MNKQQNELALAFICSCYRIPADSELNIHLGSIDHLLEREAVLMALLIKFMAVAMPHVANFKEYQRDNNPYLNSIIQEFLHDHFLKHNGDEHSLFDTAWRLAKTSEPMEPLAFIRSYYIDFATQNN